MMTSEEISYLESEGGRMAVADNLGRAPFDIALDKNLPHARLIASQVKYLTRAHRKLPSYYNAGCIVPPLAFEQSSGEEAAAMKTHSGALCIDLTCGLGVDSMNFSKRFDKVIAVEKDPALCRIAQINFGRLRAGNIEVVNSCAEDFIRKFKEKGRKADLIYIDPDRRPGSEKKQVRLRDCSPDVVDLMPQLKEIAGTVLVKASPLFDVDEAFRIFPGCSVETVSAAGECKEVIIEYGSDTIPEIGAAVAGWGKISYPYPVPPGGTDEFGPQYAYMIIPDVAIRKSRLTEKYFSGLYPGAYITPSDGYVFLRGAPGEPGEFEECWKHAETEKSVGTKSKKIPGKVFEISSMRPYRPRELREELAARGIKSANIYLHGFPLTTERICRDLRIKEGGKARLAFTVIGGALWSVELVSC